jgi:integrase
MASYLWLRGQTWFFQLRPPSDLKPTLGSSPFRVRLPVQSNRVASRYARHLAGWAERWFSAMRYRGFGRMRFVASEAAGDESWTDQDYRESQASVRRQFTDFLLAEVRRINRDAEQLEKFDSRKDSSEPAELLAMAEKQKQLFENVHAGWNEFAKTLIEDYETVFTDLQSRSRAFRSTKQDLEYLNENYEDASFKWKERISQVSAKAKKFEADFHAANKKSTRLLGKVESALDGNKKIQEELLYKGPLLSECFEEFIETKTNQLPKDSREPKYFTHRLNAFMSLVADKRIADYDIQDLDKFADQLQYLPKRHTVDPDWRGKSLEEAISENKEILAKDREDSLSYGTARVGYIGKVKTAIRWLCAQHKVRYPFDYKHVHIPKGMPPPEDRYPLSRAQLNALFRACTQDAGSKRPEDVWLPLLGYLTGARLGELVGLRTQDIKLIDGVWTGRLSSRIDDETSIAPSSTNKKRSRKKGRKNRQIKNPDSLRRFALHHKLTDLGFIDWVDRQRDEGHIYLFPELHEVKRPSGAASKRMQRLFETLEMGSEYVFHSLRHSFKDWAREGKIEERTLSVARDLSPVCSS